jgi:hypothetical protein
MAVKSNERTLMIAAMLCLGLLAGKQLVWKPVKAGWDRRAARITELDTKLFRGERLLESEEKVDREWTAMRAQSLPGSSADAESRVLAAVNRWSGESRMTVTSQRPRWLPTEPEEGGRLEVRVSGNGDMRSISRFLYELERDPLALRLEDVTIQARDERGTALTLDARLTGLVVPEEAP